MGSEQLESIEVELWLRPHLHEFLAYMSGGPLHRVDFNTRRTVLSGMVYRMLTKEHQTLDPFFTGKRRLFRVLISKSTAYKRGPWLSEDDMRMIETWVNTQFYTSLHAYANCAARRTMRITEAVREWMDVYDISAEHVDYQVLAVRLSEGNIYGLPPVSRCA